MDTNQQLARNQKEQEYKEFLKAHGSLPKGFIAVENKIDEANSNSTLCYDGDSGDYGEAFILKLEEANIDIEILQKLIEWKKAHLNYSSSYQWKVLSAVYERWIQTPENDEYKKPTLILSDSRPSIKAKMKEALKDANITFIYMISDTTYYDWLEEKVYGYAYQTYAGSVDDAATYCYWEKKVIADGYKATQMLNAAIKEKSSKLKL